MIGIATKLGALNLLRKKLPATPRPYLVALHNLIDANLKLANFAALGTSIGDLARAPAGHSVERLHTAWPSAATALGRLGIVRQHGA